MNYALRLEVRVSFGNWLADGVALHMAMEELASLDGQNKVWVTSADLGLLLQQRVLAASWLLEHVSNFVPEIFNFCC